MLYLQKLLKENQDFTHYSISQSMGRVVSCITNKIQNMQEMIDQLNMILRILFQNMMVPNIILQSGTALCIEQVI